MTHRMRFQTWVYEQAAKCSDEDFMAFMQSLSCDIAQEKKMNKPNGPMKLAISVEKNTAKLSLDGMPLRFVRDFKIEGSADYGHRLTVTLIVRDIEGMEGYPGDFEIVPDGPMQSEGES